MAVPLRPDALDDHMLSGRWGGNTGWPQGPRPRRGWKTQAEDTGVSAHRRALPSATASLWDRALPSSHQPLPIPVCRGQTGSAYTCVSMPVAANWHREHHQLPGPAASAWALFGPSELGPQPHLRWPGRPTCVHLSQQLRAVGRGPARVAVALLLVVAHLRGRLGSGPTLLWIPRGRGGRASSMRAPGQPHPRGPLGPCPHAPTARPLHVAPARCPVTMQVPSTEATQAGPQPTGAPQRPPWTGHARPPQPQAPVSRAVPSTGSLRAAASVQGPCPERPHIPRGCGTGQSSCWICKRVSPGNVLSSKPGGRRRLSGSRSGPLPCQRPLKLRGKLGVGCGHHVQGGCASAHLPAAYPQSPWEVALLGHVAAGDGHQMN